MNVLCFQGFRCYFSLWRFLNLLMIYISGPWQLEYWDLWVKRYIFFVPFFNRPEQHNSEGSNPSIQLLLHSIITHEQGTKTEVGRFPPLEAETGFWCECINPLFMVENYGLTLQLQHTKKQNQHHLQKTKKFSNQTTSSLRPQSN